MTEADLIHKVAKGLAKQYNARCPWAEYDDLYQEGAMAALRAVRAADKTREDWHGYVWTCAARKVVAAVFKAGRPVTVPTKLLREEMPCRFPSGPVDIVAPDQQPRADVLIDAYRMVVRVHGALQDLVGEQADALLGLRVVGGMSQRAKVGAARRKVLREYKKQG